jgi:hypothetical protein
MTLLPSLVLVLYSMLLMYWGVEAGEKSNISTIQFTIRKKE